MAVGVAIVWLPFIEQGQEYGQCANRPPAAQGATAVIKENDLQPEAEHPDVRAFVDRCCLLDIETNED